MSLVIVNSPGFSDAERTYLLRSNVAWQAVERAEADLGASDEPSVTAAAVRELPQTVSATTALWLKMETPSTRFAPFHKQASVLMTRLSEMATIAAGYDGAATQSAKDDVATRLKTLAAPLATMADTVAANGDALREKYGHTPSVSGPTGGLTAAEAAQIMAVLQGSVWITDPLKDADALLQVPMPQWTSSEQAAFCLDMGFIQSECDNWINTAPAGATMAYAYGEYVTGLRLLRQAAGELITAAQNLDYDAAQAGVASLQAAAPYVSRGVQSFRALLPSAFGG